MNFYIVINPVSLHPYSYISFCLVGQSLCFVAETNLWHSCFGVFFSQRKPQVDLMNQCDTFRSYNSRMAEQMSVATGAWMRAWGVKSFLFLQNGTFWQNERGCCFSWMQKKGNPGQYPLQATKRSSTVKEKYRKYCNKTVTMECEMLQSFWQLAAVSRYLIFWCAFQSNQIKSNQIPTHSIKIELSVICLWSLHRTSPIIPCWVEFFLGLLLFAFENVVHECTGLYHTLIHSTSVMHHGWFWEHLSHIFFMASALMTRVASLSSFIFLHCLSVCIFSTSVRCQVRECVWPRAERLKGDDRMKVCLPSWIRWTPFALTSSRRGGKQSAWCITRSPSALWKYLVKIVKYPFNRFLPKPKL